MVQHDNATMLCNDNFLGNLKLSTKIISVIILITVAIFSFVAYSVNVVLKEHTYVAEKEKAELLVDSVSSDITMSIYLGLNDEIEQKAKQLLKHEDVLHIKICGSDGKVIAEKNARGFTPLNDTEAIVIKKTLADSVSKAAVANVELHYSNRNYRKLVSNFQVVALKIITVSVLSTVVLLFLIRYLLRPLSKIANSIRNYKPGDTVEFEVKENKSEVGIIVASFNKMQKNINDYSEQLEYSNQNLESQVAQKTAELVELNNNLKQRVEEEIQKRVEKDKLLLQQSRLAIMGEIISMIAHQWRQPLNELSIISQSLEISYLSGELDDGVINEFSHSSNETIQKMSKTIDSFRNFFRSDNNKEEFCVQNAIENAVSLAYSMLENDNIKLTLDNEQQFNIYGYKNELEQVLLILLTNARDAMVSNQIATPNIHISTHNLDSNNIEITVLDNGGGIPEEIMGQIFDPYFSTKSKNGSGIGLYMSKEIIERQMNGKISAENFADGAQFRITLEKSVAIN